MTSVCLEPQMRHDWFISATQFLSPEGKSAAAKLLPAAERRSWPCSDGQVAIEDRLSQALSAARREVQNLTRYLGAEEAAAISSRLGALLHIDAWDDDDEVLHSDSVATMIRAIIGLGLGVPGMTIARTGNLVGTWSLDSHVLRVEAHADGTVAWTALHPRGAAPRHEHNASDTLDNLTAVVREILGQSRGNSGRG